MKIYLWEYLHVEPERYLHFIVIFKKGLRYHDLLLTLAKRKAELLSYDLMGLVRSLVSIWIGYTKVLKVLKENLSGCL